LHYNADLAAKRVADVSDTGSKINMIGAWVFTNLKFCLFRISYSLPSDFRSSSPRDPSNQNPNHFKEKSLRLLNWITQQNVGWFICTVLASDDQSSHVVGVDGTQRAIFDHEETRTLSLTQSGFDACSRGDEICIGLGEVMQIVEQLVEQK
jgi:hypothetical protein